MTPLLDQTPPPAAVFRDVGDTALAVEFGEAIDPVAEARVQALDLAVTQAGLPGVVETVPTYRSLLLHYDPDTITPAALEAALRPMLAADPPPRARRRWIVPACYDPALAEDLAEAAALAGLSPDRLAALHGAAEWQVAMFGFAPGFAYLSGCPPELAIPRRAAPRPPIPPGSLMIAGGQGLIAPTPMPTGWYVVGRTALRTFLPEAADPFLLAVGDRLRFEPVPADVHSRLLAEAAAGAFVARPA